jgi:hypothetical protein
VPRSRSEELPPTHTARPPVDPPANSNEGRPTAAQLNADIDSGRTGDKNPALDPSLAPLGTDDEAAGTPPTPFRVMLARRLENLNRWVRSSSRAAGPKPDSDPILFLSLIGAISLVLLAGVVFASRA